MMSHIPLIAVTGGAGAGKSTGMARLVAACQEMGFTPLVAREAARDLIEAGLDRYHPTFQAQVLVTMLHQETLLLQAALSGHYPNPVVLCDRGVPDGAAYLTSEQFGELLQQHNLSLVEVRDRYAGAIFLDSAAVGAEEFYDDTNRDETLEEAKVLNQRTLEAWYGTPHLIQVPNRPGASFDDKMDEAVRALARILGVPEPIEIEKKFRLYEFTISMLPQNAAAIDIRQTYLLPAKPGSVERVRARGQHGSWRYFHTIKEPFGPGQSIEHDRLIDEREYHELLRRKDDSLCEIVKTRYCFTYAHQYVEIDEFHSHRHGLTLLEVELHDAAAAVKVPPFLGRFKDVTDDDRFANRSLADPEVSIE